MSVYTEAGFAVNSYRVTRTPARDPRYGRTLDSCDGAHWLARAWSLQSGADYAIVWCEATGAELARYAHGERVEPAFLREQAT